MVVISVSNDLLFNLADAAGNVGQQPYKKQFKLDTVSTWNLTETLNDLKEFSFIVKKEDFTKANVLMERNISVPLLTPFHGIIIEKSPLQDSVKFTAKENAWHLKRKLFQCHDKPRILYTKDKWFNKLWRFRRNLKISGKKLTDISTGNDLINFPLLFHTTDVELKVHSRSDGNDILFTKTETDGTVTQLHHEIEYYDFATGELWAWIEFPEIRSGQDTEFQMYFGYDESSNQQNPNGTWDDYLGGFALVQHLNANSIDSTSNTNDGTDTSIVYNNGKIAHAAEFNASTSKIAVAADATINDLFAATSGGWITSWIQPYSGGEGGSSYILEKGGDSSTGWYLQINSASAGFCKLKFLHTFSGTDGSWETTNATIPLNEFTRIDVFYDNSATTNDPNIYINGVLQVIGTTLTESSTPTGTADTDSGSSLFIGNNTGQTKTFDGTIEEVRFLKSPPNNLTELIKMEFASQKTPEDYVIIGQAEERIQQADIIADSIIRVANRDMPILNTTPISNLLSLWRLDGNTTDDKSGYNGTWTGSETYVKGFFNTEVTERAAKFDGSSYISTSNNPFSFNIGNAFTIQLKFKTLSAAEQILISKRTNNTAGSAGYSIYLTSAGLPVVEFSNGTSEWSITGSLALNDNDWHTLLFTYDGSSNRDGMSLYIDGLLHVSGTSSAITGSLSNSLNLTFGAGAAGALPFTGVIDDVRVYTKEFSDKEADRLHKMTQSDLDIIQTKLQWKLGNGHVTELDNLISLWQFNETLIDTKSNHDLHLHAGTESYVDMKYGKGFNFTGSEFLHVHGTQTDYDIEYNEPMSISLWFKGSNTGSNEEIITKHDGTKGWHWFFNSSDELVFEVDDGTNAKTFTVTDNLRDGVLHHLVVTYDGTATGCKMYSDGVALTTTPGGVFPTATIVNTNVVHIGATTAETNFLTGALDDVRFHTDVLTETEVKRLAEATDSGVTRIRDDNISTKEIEIEFVHNDCLESLKKIAKVLGVQISFDSGEYKIFITNKGKTIKNVFNKILINNPSFNLNNVANIVNVLGAEENGIQKEKKFTSNTTLKYNYEKTFADKKITTDDTLDLVGNEILTSLQDLTPDLQIETTPDQFNRYDLQVGDKLKINEISQDLQGTFTIIRINTTIDSVKLSLSATKNTTIQTTGKDLTTIISDIVSSVQDLNITPE